MTRNLVPCSLDPTLSKFSPGLTPTAYFLEIHHYIILPYVSEVLFPPEFCVHFLSLFHACYTSHQCLAHLYA